MSEPGRPLVEWDLVQTHDGYYGIVTDDRHCYLFLSNGVELRCSAEDWAKLKPLPLNIFDGDGGARANFDGILRALTNRRMPAAQPTGAEHLRRGSPLWGPGEGPDNGQEND